MMEVQLIVNLLNKENYNKYREYIKPSKETEKYYECLDKLHSSLDRNISLEEFTAMCPDFPVPTTFFSDDIINIKLGEIKQRQWAYDHAILAVDIAEGRKTLDQLLSHVEKLDKVKHSVKIHEDSLDVFKDLSPTSGIPFRLKELQEATLGLRGGDLAVFFARTNVGKSTFLASEVTHMAEHVDKPIIYFNNEQRGNAVKLRLIESSLGWSTDQIKVDYSKTLNLYLEKTHGNIKLVDDATLTHWELKKYVEELEPSLICVDQLDKIKGFKADRHDLEVGAIYIFLREVAKKYNIPVLGVTQASESAEGKKWLTTKDMAESKTSKAAECDLLVGIGKSNEEGYENLRYLNILKNKGTGDERRIECRFRKDIGRYESF